MGAAFTSRMPDRSLNPGKQACLPLLALLVMSSACEDTPCTAPLQTFGCEMMFAAQKARDIGFPTRSGMCGPYLIVGPNSPGGGYCLYDQGSETLIAAEGGSDLKSFCGGTSYTIHGGLDVNPWSLCSIDDLTSQ